MVSTKTPMTQKAKIDGKAWFKRYRMVLVLVVIVIFCGIIEPRFLSSANILNLFRQISNNGIISIGMAVVIICGGIDLGVGSYVCLVSILVIMLQAHMHWIPATIIVLALGCLIGAFNGFCIHKGMAPFIMTMASMTVIRGIAMLITNGYSVQGIQDGFAVIGRNRILGIPIPFLIYILMIVIFYIFLQYTPSGRAIYAVGGNAEAARLSGISLLKTRVLAYLLSGFTSAVAGVVLIARLGSSLPSLGEGYELDAIAGVVIGGISMSGGKGNIFLSIAGVFIIGILNNILNLLNVNPYIQEIAKGLIIFVAVAVDSWKKKE